jgi:hypothetical protein
MRHEPTNGLQFLLQEAHDRLPWGTSIRAYSKEGEILGWAEEILCDRWLNSASCGKLAASLVGIWDSMRKGTAVIKDSGALIQAEHLFLHLENWKATTHPESVPPSKAEQIWYWAHDQNCKILALGGYGEKSFFRGSDLVRELRASLGLDSSKLMTIIHNDSLGVILDKNNTTYNYKIIAFRPFFIFNKEDRSVSLSTGKSTQISNDIQFRPLNIADESKFLLKFTYLVERQTPLLDATRLKLDSIAFRERVPDLLPLNEWIDFDSPTTIYGTWRKEYKRLLDHLGKIQITKSKNIRHIDDQDIGIMIWQHFRMKQLYHRISYQLTETLLENAFSALRQPILMLTTIIHALECLMLEKARSVGAPWPQEGMWRWVSEATPNIKEDGRKEWTVPKSPHREHVLNALRR